MHLRDWMRQHEVTQQELARRMRPPVSQAKVSHWLQGTRRVDLRSALQLVEITAGEVTVHDLADMAAASALAGRGLATAQQQEAVHG